MGHSQEVERINALRERGYFVRVVRRRPIEIGLDLMDVEDRVERIVQTDGLYLRSEVDAIRRIDEVAYCRFAGKGGETVVRIEDAEGVVAEGHAVCRRDEAFHRKWGLRIALGRAEKDLDLHHGQLADVRAINADTEAPA